jgi:indolepyruvate ferredoxin oxidoreductase
LAYKDEYEVARLFTEPGFRQSLQRQFTGDTRVEFNLAPALLARPDPVTGIARKRAFGPWILVVFRLLARLKWLRGSKLDLFGYTAERRMERQLISDYELQIGEILENLTTRNFDAAVALAELPESIRGFGHVKARHVEEARVQWETLRAAFLNAREP